MKRPPYGLCLPCRFLRARDGDTVEVQISGAFVWAIRLIECWCAETNRGTPAERARGQAAKKKAVELLVEAELLSVWIPPPDQVLALCGVLGITRGAGPINLLAMATFDRLPGHIFLSDKLTLSEALVNAGHATTEKVRAA